MQSAPPTESTGTMLMHPCLRLRYARALLTNSQDLCPRRIVLATNGVILPMVKIVRVGLTIIRVDRIQLIWKAASCGV
jgi:hypothetical protein